MSAPRRSALIVCSLTQGRRGSSLASADARLVERQRGLEEEIAQLRGRMRGYSHTQEALMQQLEASQAERDEKTAMAAAQTALLEAKVHVASGLQTGGKFMRRGDGFRWPSVRRRLLGRRPSTP